MKIFQRRAREGVADALECVSENVGDALGSITVAEGRNRSGARSGLVASSGEELASRREDTFRIGSHQTCPAAIYSLGSFGRVARHEHRRAQGSGLLLNSSGIRDDKQGTTCNGQEFRVAERLEQEDVWQTGEHLCGSLPHVGIRVDREKNLQFRLFVGELADGLEDATNRLAKALAAVLCHEDKGAGEEGLQWLREDNIFLHCDTNGVDDRVANHVDLGGGDSFSQQIGTSVLGGGEVVHSHMRDQAPIDFFGERGIGIVSAQASFDVSYGDALVESRECGAEGRGRVPLDDHEIGAALFEEGCEAGDGPDGELREGLARRHDREAGIGLLVEQLESLLEKFVVLTCGAGLDMEALRVRPQSLDERKQLDGFRSGAEDDEQRFSFPGSHAGLIRLAPTLTEQPKLDKVGSACRGAQKVLPCL